MNGLRRSPVDVAASVAALLGVVGLRRAASHGGWISRVFFATPEATWACLREGLAGGELAGFTAATAWRMVQGWLLESLLGVGQAILLAARAFRASELFAGIALLGLIGLVSDALLGLAERQSLQWQVR